MEVPMLESFAGRTPCGVLGGFSFRKHSPFSQRVCMRQVPSYWNKIGPTFHAEARGRRH
jgi:hypothetical protein